MRIHYADTLLGIIILVSVTRDGSGLEDDAYTSFLRYMAADFGKAITVVEEGSNLTEDAIISHCAERLARFKLPQSVEFTDALPNATGKVLKTKPREQFGDGSN